VGAVWGLRGGAGIAAELVAGLCGGVDIFNRSGPADDGGTAKNTTDVVCRRQPGLRFGDLPEGREHRAGWPDPVVAKGPARLMPLPFFSPSQRSSPVRRDEADELAKAPLPLARR